MGKHSHHPFHPPQPPSHRPFPHPPLPHRPPGLPKKRRFLFLRFAVLVILLGLLFVVAVVVMVAVLSSGPQRPPLPPHRPTGSLALAACAVPLLFFFLIILLGGLAFRRIGSPVAEVMAAADAVAAGDLSVRVRDDLRGEFGRLAASFNRMTAELARGEQQRRNLTADVAHELRTPLHIIQGNLEGILDGVYEPSAEHIQATLEETHLLARLVNDLQMLSLAEAGQLPLHQVRCSARDLLADVATSFAGQAAEQGVSLEVENGHPTDAADEDLAIFADPDRLDQVLSNLVANALRYTPASGRIRLAAAAMDGWVRLTVSDNGAGIPPEDVPYIFDRFWRGDRARTRHSGAGSGLGLAIARQLVQSHGGRIMVESQPGVGTRFTIDLPRYNLNRAAA